MTETQTETINRFGVKAGDIFYASWGYDQTNVDFYEVVRVTAAKAEIRPIGSAVAEDGITRKVVPDPSYAREWDVLIGINRDDAKKTKLCTVKTGYKGDPTIVLASGEHWAYRWEGGSLYETHPYFGH